MGSAPVGLQSSQVEDGGPLVGNIDGALNPGVAGQNDEDRTDSQGMGIVLLLIVAIWTL